MPNRIMLRWGAWGLMVLLGLMGCERPGTSSTQPSTSTQPTTAAAGVQTVCPVSNYDIDPTQYVDYKGKRVYLCCEGCRETFLKYADQFVVKLPQFGGRQDSSLGKMPK